MVRNSCKMCDFDIIEAGFNNADETINFGSRPLEDPTNLFEISTLACLKSSDEGTIQDNVSVDGMVCNNKVFFHINNTIKAFGNKECTHLVYYSVFNDIIDSICVTPNSKYMLICLRNGFINLVDFESEEKSIIFEECIDSDLVDNICSEKFFTNSFVETCNNEEIVFLTVLRKGKSFRIILKLNNNQSDGNKSTLQIESLYDFSSRLEIAAFQYPNLLVSGADIFILNVNTKVAIKDTCYRIKEVYPIGQKFLALDVNGNLLLICSATLIIINLYSETLFQNMVIISGTSKNHIVALTAPNEDGDLFIQRLFYPNLSVMFSIKLSYDVCLLQDECDIRDFDDTIFISKVFKKTKELRFNVVCETQKEKRLVKLLKKQQFEEAEKFAQIFQLDMTIITKAKAQLIADKSLCNSADIDLLIEILNLIDDNHFKLNTCLNVDCISAEDVRRILIYGSTLAVKSDANETDVLLGIQETLRDTLFKFDTFMALYNSYDIQEWSTFLDCNLIEELKNHLKNYRIEEAIKIYSRLDKFSANQLSDSVIKDILDILNNLSIKVYQPFLPTFVPITLMYRSTALPIFVKWLQNKLFQFEKQGCNFPDNAINFYECVVQLFKVKADNNTNLMLETQRNYFLALKELQTLKNDYGISIPLFEYLKGPRTIISILLNVTMSPENYDQFVQKYLLNFMLLHQLDHNEIFLNEIKNLIKYEEKYWLHLVDCTLNYISSTKIKLDAIKIVLEFANIPWCETVRKIGQNALKYAHPMVEDIRKILEQEPILVVLRRPKYKINVRALQNFEFIVNRICYVNEPTIVEDVFQLCQTPKHRHIVNTVLIHKFIKMGKYERALSILENNKPEEIAKLSDELIKYCQVVISDRNSFCHHYYNIVGTLFNNFRINSANKFGWATDDIRIIKSVYNINKNFNLKIKSSDLIIRQAINETYEKLLDKTIKKFENKSDDILALLSDCNKIAYYLNLNKEDVTIKFCEKNKNFEVILKAAQYLYENCSNTRNLCMVALLLLKYEESCNKPLMDDTINFDSTILMTVNNISDDRNTVLNCLKLAEKIVDKAILNAGIDDFAACQEVMNWVNSYYYLTKTSEKVNTFPGYSTFNYAKQIFTLYCRYICQFRNENTRYLTYFVDTLPQLSQDDFFKEMAKMPKTIDILCKDGQHLSAFKLFTTLQNGLKYAVNLDEKNACFINTLITKKCTTSLLHLLASSSNIDKSLFYNILMVCGDSDAVIKIIIYFLKLYKRQPDKLRDISEIGLKLIDFYQLKVSKEPMILSILTVKWWKRIMNCKISYDAFFKQTKAEIRLEMMMKFDYVNEHMIAEYCLDFGLDVQHFYKVYLKKTLSNFKPNYEINTGIDGKRKLIVDIHEDEILIKKCLSIIQIIENKESILGILNEIWYQLNFYYYEVFSCISKIRLQLTTSNANSHLSMLKFLMNYQRFNQPSQTEEEQWYTAFPDKNSLDVLSEFRLPFTNTLFTDDIWNIIRSEINLKTYKYWFDAVKILKSNLNKDDICTIAVKEVVSSGILSKKSSEWLLHPKHDDLFDEIDKCVKHMSNLEVCTAVLNHVVNQTPRGADQLSAAALCYEYAYQYYKQYPNRQDVEEAYMKVKKKYYNFSAMHILVRFQLNEEKYMELVAQPKELVIALYLDEKIIKKAESVELFCPDFNKAIDELADFFELDVLKIRYDLLNNWLTNDCLNTELDSTIIMLHNAESVENCNFVWDDNLKRAAYVCESGDLFFWQQLLLKIGLGDPKLEETETINSALCKARALKCFCGISDMETIEKLTEVKYEELLNYIDKLYLVKELENLGIEVDFVHLDRNIKDLVKRVIRQGSNPVNINVMATICMSYKIKSIKYWEFIINNAIKLKMIKELKVFVEFLKCLYYTNFYIKAWQLIVDDEFCSLASIANLSETEIMESYIKKFLMIQSCSVLYSLNFENAIIKCLEIGKYLFAAVFLQYLPCDKKDTYAKDILSSCETIYKDLDILSKRGVWGLQNVKAYLGTVEY